MVEGTMVAVVVVAEFEERNCTEVVEDCEIGDQGTAVEVADKTVH